MNLGERHPRRRVLPEKHPRTLPQLRPIQLHPVRLVDPLVPVDWLLGHPALLVVLAAELVEIVARLARTAVLLV